MIERYSYLFSENENQVKLEITFTWVCIFTSVHCIQNYYFTSV